MIRADATAQTGAGHAMRCLTLAEAWLVGGYGPARLAGEITIPFVADRLSKTRVGRAPADAASTGDDVLVVDTYDDAVRDRLSSAPARLRVLADDVGCAVPSGYGVLWNPNAYGADVGYDDFAGTKLAGADYVPIRSGLPAWTEDGSKGTLAALGGGTLATEVRTALRSITRQFTAEKFFAMGDQLSGEWEAVHPEQLWVRAAGCARAVIGAGVTTWEFAAVGIPVVLLVLADNQSLIGRWASRAGVPVVDCRNATASDIEAQLATALVRARPLPRIADGAGRVARHLADAAMAVSA